MNKQLLILLLSAFILFSCSEKKVDKVLSEPSEMEIAENIYDEAVKALESGDAYYAQKKFNEVESLMPQSEWASKASLMTGYADYSRSAYSQAIFTLKRISPIGTNELLTTRIK